MLPQHFDFMCEYDDDDADADVDLHHDTVTLLALLGMQVANTIA